MSEKANASREESHEADPAMLRGFLHLNDDTPDELVKLIAEADIASERQKGEYRDAEARRSRLREGWEKLTPDGSLPFVPMPIEIIFTLPVTKYIRGLEKSIGCDAAALAIPTLGQLAAAVGNSYRVQIKENEWDEPSTIWVFNLGKSGTHKSVVQRAVLAPMKKKAKGAYVQYADEMELYEEKLSNWNNEKKGNKPTPPVCERFALADTTIEAQSIIQAANPRGVPLARPEGSGWIGGMDQYKKGGGAELQAWVEFWDGDDMVIDRKTGIRTVHIPAPCTTVITGTQPGTLRRVLTAGHFDSGFWARVLMCEPPTRPRRFRHAGISEDVRTGYYDVIDGLYARDVGGDPISLSPEAEALWERFYNASADATESVKSDRLRAAFIKLETYAARFALILHLSAVPPGQAPPAVTFDAMHRAVVLTLWFRHETARLYDLYGFSIFGSSKHAEKAEELPERFTAEDVEGVWKVGRSQAFRIVGKLVIDGLAKPDGHGYYRKETGDLCDLCDFDGVRVDIKPLLAGLEPDSRISRMSHGSLPTPNLSSPTEPSTSSTLSDNGESMGGDGVISAEDLEAEFDNFSTGGLEQ